MSREAQAAPLALAAALLLRLGLTDAHLAYVKPGMRPWLLVAGFVLAVLALTRFFRREEPAAHDAHDDPAEHAHGRGALPWLLALPFAAVVVVAPTPLASFAAQRQAPRPPEPPSSGVDAYPELPPEVDGAYELSLSELTSRVAFDDERSLEGRTVRLVGFVTPAEEGEQGFLLTRFMLACCASDGIPIQVAVHGLEVPVPPADIWLEVEALWQPADSERQPDIPVVDAASLREIPQPAEPYES